MLALLRVINSIPKLPCLQTRVTREERTETVKMNIFLSVGVVADMILLASRLICGADSHYTLDDEKVQIRNVVDNFKFW